VLDFGGSVIMDFGAQTLEWVDVVTSAPPTTALWGYIKVVT